MVYNHNLDIIMSNNSVYIKEYLLQYLLCTFFIEFIEKLFHCQQDTLIQMLCRVILNTSGIRRVYVICPHFALEENPAKPPNLELFECDFNSLQQSTRRHVTVWLFFNSTKKGKKKFKKRNPIFWDYCEKKNEIISQKGPKQLSLCCAAFC